MTKCPVEMWHRRLRHARPALAQGTGSVAELAEPQRPCFHCSHRRALIILVCVSFAGWLLAAWLAKRFSTDVRAGASCTLLRAHLPVPKRKYPKRLHLNHDLAVKILILLLIVTC